MDWNSYKKDDNYGLKVGEQIRIRIEGMGAKGDPFGKYKGIIVFVKTAGSDSIGKDVTIEITEVKEKCIFGKLV